jgi:hypothetical protein
MTTFDETLAQFKERARAMGQLDVAEMLSQLALEIELKHTPNFGTVWTLRALSDRILASIEQKQASFKVEDDAHDHA